MKNSQNNLPDITPDTLISGQLSSRVPELYAQKDVIAINPWHDHQSVFDHTVAVVSSAQHIMTFPYADTDSKKILVSRLDETFGGVPRRELVLVAALLHDIGCGRTLVTDPKTGENSCPDHEKTGAAMCGPVLARWGCTEAVIHRVTDVVFRHLDIHRAVNESLARGEPDAVFTAFHASVGDLYFDLLIQGYADMAGSDLPVLDHRAFDIRENIYKEEIMRFAASR